MEDLRAFDMPDAIWVLAREDANIITFLDAETYGHYRIALEYIARNYKVTPPSELLKVVDE